MRLDKYLKVSRIIKRRTVANEACDGEHVYVNGRIVRASYEVHLGDEITVAFGKRKLTVRVTKITETAGKDSAGEMYEIISQE